MKSALFVWGGWKGHEPKQCVEIFAPFLKKKGFEVEVSDTLDTYLDEEKIRSLDLIVQAWTLGAVTGKQVSGLLNAIKSGVGIAGQHGGRETHSETIQGTSLWSADNGWHIPAAS